jgi:hypothetical protein
VLHAQLFEQQPALAFLPLFVVGLVAHFFIRARSADASRAAAVEAGQVHPLLPQEDKEAGDDHRSRIASLGGGGARTAGSQPHHHPHHPAPLDLDLDLAEDCDNDSSSSIYSSPVEDDDRYDDDGDRERDRDRDWEESGGGLYEVYGEGELDPDLFLELQQHGGDDSAGLQSAVASLQDDGDGARQSLSGRSSDYNDPSDGTGSWFDDE